MNVTVFSSSLNHHVVGVYDELYKELGNDFHFVATVPPSFDSAKGGEDYSHRRPYCIRASENADSRKQAFALAVESDVCRFGSCSLPYAIERAKKNPNGLSFESGERWLKRGFVNIFSPRLIKWWFTYMFFFRNANFYYLCNSAYAAIDLKLLGAYNGRCFRWGYFTRVDDDFEVEVYKQGTSASIMWCSRFLKLKHPELPVRLAYMLRTAGYNFSIDMFGDGCELEKTKILAKALDVEDVVSFKGALPNDMIIKEMRKHSIFLFTSDRNEGWGAVANESMSNGCVLVASDAIGSTPFLIKDKVNGMVFSSKSLESLFEKVSYLINHPDDRIEMSKNAICTMRNMWSPKQAASNFMRLSIDLLNGRESSILEGPCSRI